MSVLSLIIPVYNEEKNLPLLYDSIKHVHWNPFNKTGKLSSWMMEARIKAWTF